MPWKSFEKIVPYTNLFLYDIKCLDEKRHIDGTGVSNRLILENLKRLSQTQSEIIIRIPVIPGFSGDEAEMKKISEFLKNIRHTGVELLPYHKMGEHKYQSLNLDCHAFDVPDETKMAKYRAMFE